MCACVVCVCVCVCVCVVCGVWCVCPEEKHPFSPRPAAPAQWTSTSPALRLARTGTSRVDSNNANYNH